VAAGENEGQQMVVSVVVGEKGGGVEVFAARI